MFCLSEELDDVVNLDGRDYALDMSFDNILRFFDLLKDETIAEVYKVEIALRMFLDDPLSDYDFEKKCEIYTQLLKVVMKVEEEEVLYDITGKEVKRPPKKHEEACYSLKHDAEYIYASFMQAYNIDLFEQQGKLHWQKFKALLNGLPEGTKFRQVIDIRTRELPTGKHSQKEKRALEKLKKQYALPKED